MNIAPNDASTLRERIAEFRKSLDAVTPHAWVTPALVAVNLLVYVAFGLSNTKNFSNPPVDALIAWGADYAPATTHGQWWRLVTSMFMHIGFVHVAMNMYVLWSAGRLVEKMTGNFPFLVAYFVSGVGGTIASELVHPQIVSAGASGAVFGVYGLLGAILLRNRAAIPKEVLQHLGRGAVVFIGYNVVYGMTKTSIDQTAHIGGLATGFACGLALEKSLVPEGAAARTKRAGLVLAVSVVLLFIGARMVPRGVDYFAELAALDKSEGAALAAYNRIVADKALTNAATADALDREVLAPWKSMHEHWRSLRGLSDKQKTAADKIERYLQERELGFAAMVESARHDDLEGYEAGAKRVHAALDLAKGE